MSDTKLPDRPGIFLSTETEIRPVATIALLRDTDGSKIIVPFLLGTPANNGIERAELSKEQKENMIYAVDTLLLPPVMAVHLICNIGLDRKQIEDQYGIPDEGAFTPITAFIYGPSLAGKSTFLAVAERLFQNPPIAGVCLDGFSPQNLGLAREILKDITVDRGSLGASIVNLVESLKSGLKEITNWPQSGDFTVRQGLDLLCEVFKSGERPPIVLADMPGRRVDLTSGEPTDLENIFDWAAQLSAPSIMLSRLIEDEGIEKRATLQDMDPSVIIGYIDMFVRYMQHQASNDFREYDEFLADFRETVLKS